MFLPRLTPLLLPSFKLFCMHYRRNPLLLPLFHFLFLVTVSSVFFVNLPFFQLVYLLPQDSQAHSVKDLSNLLRLPRRFSSHNRKLRTGPKSRLPALSCHSTSSHNCWRSSVLAFTVVSGSQSSQNPPPCLKHIAFRTCFVWKDSTIPEWQPTVSDMRRTCENVRNR